MTIIDGHEYAVCVMCIKRPIQVFAEGKFLRRFGRIKTLSPTIAKLPRCQFIK